jgi:electron transport complex protein RnfD
MNTLVHAPHAHAPTSVPRLMALVMGALVPATLLGFWLYGWPAVNLWCCTVLACVAAEYACLRLAGMSPAAYLGDGSAVLTAWLLALSLPPWAPWWIGALGGAFAIAIGKHVFGGIGQNPFNPAMLARVMLLISFPVEMTTWNAPTPLFSSTALSFADGLTITFGGLPPADAVSGASLLGHIKTELIRGTSIQQAMAGHFDPALASVGMRTGSLGETSAALLAAGGLLLLWRRAITWHIPVAMLLGVALPAAALHLLDPARYASAMLHLLSGSVILGAFFIATDPVTSPSSRGGQIVFGAGCGLMTYIIRTWGGYPEGVAFAVLLMNAATPIIDRYLRPRVYGRTRRGTSIATESTKKQ